MERKFSVSQEDNGETRLLKLVSKELSFDEKEFLKTEKSIGNGTKNSRCKYTDEGEFEKWYLRTIKRSEKFTSVLKGLLKEYERRIEEMIGGGKFCDDSRKNELSDCYLMRAIIMGRNFRKYEEAQKLLSRALEYNPKSLEAFWWKGFCLRKGKSKSSFSKLAELGLKTIKDFPDSPYGYVLLGNSKVYAIFFKDLKEAMRLYEIALQKDPKFYYAKAGMGRAHKSRGDVHQAIVAFTEANELSLDREMSYNNLGACFYGMQGEWNATLIRYYKLAILFNPRCAEAFYNLGLVYEELRCELIAIRCFQRAIYLHPSFRDKYMNEYDLERTAVALTKICDVRGGDIGMEELQILLSSCVNVKRVRHFLENNLGLLRALSDKRKLRKWLKVVIGDFSVVNKKNKNKKKYVRSETEIVRYTNNLYFTDELWNYQKSKVYVNLTITTSVISK